MTAPSSGTNRHEVRTYRRQTRAATDARIATREVLAAWHVDEAEADDAALVVTELVGNAAQHSFGPVVTLTLTLTGELLLIEVYDSAALVQEAVRSEPTSEEGRGLLLVAALSVQSGGCAVPGGKVMWAELACTSPAAGRDDSESEVLPSGGGRGAPPEVTTRAEEAASRPAPGTDVAQQRDTAANTRDGHAGWRDGAGDRRDDHGRSRDEHLLVLDLAAAERDAAADRRDADALLQAGADRSVEGRLAARQSATDRGAAALDRASARRDRLAGARGRLMAAEDRLTSESDRTSAADDRRLSLRDRGASAHDREDSSLDALTGAYVRGPGLRQLDREVLRAGRLGEPLTVAFLDVDHLKALNDARGHAAGDRLLVRVSTSVRKRLRPYDLVVRYGGDEFVCVLFGIGHEDTEERFALVNRDLEGHGSVTVGVVTMQPGEDPAALVARADEALYARRATRSSEAV